MKSFLLIYYIIFLCIQTAAKETPIQKQESKKRKQNISSDQRSTAYIDINYIRALQGNNGFSDFNIDPNKEGFEWPKGSGKTAVFQSGILWGGYVQGDKQVRVGGATYLSGLQPGPIQNNGNAAPNPNTDNKWRIFRVRSDVGPGGLTIDLTDEAQLEGISTDVLRSQYETDWNEWPAAGTSNDLGAPFTDVNLDGVYEPAIDIPGVPGANQTIYYTANDQDSILTKKLYGTLPMGIELHATIWAYAQAGELGSMYFKKYVMINKGYQHNTISGMLFSFWVDPDLGEANNDLAGTDNNIPPNLIYTYNGNSTDAVYAPDVPPCIGFALLQGPIVTGQQKDTAIFNGSIFHGRKNLPITSSYCFVAGFPNYQDPTFGQASGATNFIIY